MLIIVAHIAHTLIFTLYSHGNLPHLHSFPTRRSSDLSAATANRRAIGFDPQRYIRLQSQHIQERREQIGGKLYLELGGDRKSTRLNSSHVASSYAVFCLRKKTRQY